MRNTIFTILTILVSTSFLLGADDHYAITGKLTTVIACVAVVLIGIAAFLFYLERRISKLENDLDE